MNAGRAGRLAMARNLFALIRPAEDVEGNEAALAGAVHLADAIHALMNKR